MAEKEMSQGELATLIGMGKSSVSQYISGKNIPKHDVQVKMAEVLDCTVEFLNSKVTGEECNSVSRLTPEQASKRLGVSAQGIRVALQQGTAPYGYAWKVKTKWSHHISPKLLDEYIGKEII